LFRRLTEVSPAPCAAFVDCGEFQLASSSPELFLRLSGAHIQTRPIKGTRPRSSDATRDAQLAYELQTSAKEQAELVMITDLLRNDLGRVAVPGSVAVTAPLAVERLRTVWQLTSTVEAHLRPGVDLVALFQAAFPCGSVTGAPKPSAMRLIAAEEATPRGAYCGAVGAVAPGGDACFNVAIRTVELDLPTGEARYGVGGGITWGSDAAAEWDEALAKAAVLALHPARPTLLETMRLEGGRVALLDGHLARLGGSAAWHGLPFDPAAARALVAAQGGQARLRLLLGPDGGLALERAGLPAPLDGPVRLGFAVAPVSSRDPALFHKTTDRAGYEARRAERPDCFDVILVNQAGAPTETSFGNLVVELEGARYTPPLEAGLLPGVFRADLLARGEVRERPLRREELERAPRLWLVNSLRGWVAARLAPPG
jgi:para-aminobenzoate synthetase/4-amino-4-deoxychorismate lyase